MSFANFQQKYIISPLHDRKDFMKAWLQDNDKIPKKLKKGINIIYLSNSIYIIYANDNKKAVGILNLHKNAIEHIVVNDKYKGMGIATKLLKEAKKLGANDVISPISPEFANLSYKFIYNKL